MLEDIYTLSRRFLSIKNKPHKRNLIQEDLFTHRLTLLAGQRGIGKTTALVQYLLDQVNGDQLSNEILYVPTDHFLLAKKSLYEIAEQFDKLGGKYIVLDEIHKYPNWSQEIKSIYDTFPSLKVLASGSSALKIYKGSHDLTRRAIVINAKGLSFREYLALNLNIILPYYTLEDIIQNHEALTKNILNKLEKSNHKILLTFQNYLQFGYYPYFLEIKDKKLYWITLEQNFHTIIESDLPAIYPSLTGNSIKKIKQLLTFIASAVPFTPNWKKLKNLLEISDERTLKAYFKHLEDGGLIRTVMKASKKLSKLETPEKAYLDNPNQFYAISSNTRNQGTVREIFFLSMLSKTHDITIPITGDFLIDNHYTFEIGGKNKDFTQIKNKENAYLACDNIDMGANKKIPLWLFGFLY